MEAALTHDEFSKNLNTKFHVQFDENPPVELELIKVSEIKVYPQQEEFAIEFRGPLDLFLTQGIFIFKHEQIGQFEIFIVPIGKDEQGFKYEAVFNRVRNSS